MEIRAMQIGRKIATWVHLPIGGGGAAVRAVGAGRQLRRRGASQPSLKLRLGTRIRDGIAELPASPSLGRRALAASHLVIGRPKGFRDYRQVRPACSKA